MGNDFLLGLAKTMLSRHPDVANDPKNKEMVQAIMDGNSDVGNQLAQNICNSYGVKPEDIIAKGRKMLGI